MPLACNINRKGRTVRLINGIVTIAMGIALAIFWTLPKGGLIAWAITILFLLSGTFAIFESAIGWCAIRAMGYRTKI